MRWLRSLLAFSVCVALARGGHAQDKGGLAHEEALRIAATRNLTLLVQSLARSSAEAEARMARRPYLPELAVEASVSDTPGEERRAIDLSPSLSYLSPYGTAVRMSATFTEGLAGNPAEGRDLTIELTQALLRGGFHAGAGADLDAADLKVVLQKQVFRESLNDLLQRADRVYWELAFAAEDREIKRRSRDRARSQFEETQENIRRGLLAQGEIYIVEESLTDFEERLSRAEEALSLAKLEMQAVLRWAPNQDVTPTTAVDVAGAPEVSDAESVAAAKRGSPALIAARIRLRAADLDTGIAKSQAYPELDAFGSATVRDGTDERGILLSDNPDLRAGLRLSIPLYWGPDSARVDRAVILRRAQALSVEAAEENAAFEVLRAATILRGRTHRLDLASRIVELSRQKLDVEREKYKSGISTLADVVRFQRELDAALGSSLRARIDVLTARTDLAAARGDLHDSLGITVE